MVEAKASGLPHVLRLGKQGHAPCNIFLLQQVLFWCQFKLLKIKSFHGVEVISGGLQLLGILPD